jgi:hypothetical protein
VAAVFEAPAALLAAEPVAAPLDAAVASAVVDWAVDPAVAAALSDAGRPPANAVLPAVIIDPTTKYVQSRRITHDPLKIISLYGTSYADEAIFHDDLIHQYGNRYT